MLSIDQYNLWKEKPVYINVSCGYNYAQQTEPWLVNHIKNDEHDVYCLPLSLKRWLYLSGISFCIANMAFNDNNKYNLSIAILYFIVLITRLTNCQETCSKTSSTLECYSCSNTSPSKQCSDDTGKPTTSKWSVLKSNPGASTADFR